MGIPIARPYLDDNEERAVIEALRSGWISHGPKSVEFESAMARTIGVTYGRAVNSGTSAIHLILLACGIQAGDEVLVPAFTCVASLFPLEHIGAVPILVDAELDTFGLDPRYIESAITSRTKAIMVMHPFGQAVDMDAIMVIAARHQLKVVEDNALGFGGKIGGRWVGSFGDASCLSFHPRKLLTTGEGGMVLTGSAEIADRVAALRAYGASVAAWERHQGKLFELPRYEQAGFNLKMTDIQAAIGLQQLRKLPEILEKRRRIAMRYNEAFAALSWMQCPKEQRGRTHAYQSYVSLLRPDGAYDAGDPIGRRFMEHLAAAGIASVQAAQSMAAIDYFRARYGWEPANFPNALVADQRAVALPIHPALSLGDQDAVIDAVRAFCA